MQLPQNPSPTPAVKVAVIYYSATGSVRALAVAAAEAAEKDGAQVRLRKVQELAPAHAIAANQQWADHHAATAHIDEATVDDLAWADVILLGSPTRFGLPAAQLKQFLDLTGGLWARGGLIDKVCSAFTSTGTVHGGQESTILAIANTFYHWGAIIVPPGYADSVEYTIGNPYGTSHVSDNGRVPPGDAELAAIAFQTRRAIRIARSLHRTTSTDQ